MKRKVKQHKNKPDSMDRTRKGVRPKPEATIRGEPKPAAAKAAPGRGRLRLEQNKGEEVRPKEEITIKNARNSQEVKIALNTITDAAKKIEAAQRTKKYPTWADRDDEEAEHAPPRRRARGRPKKRQAAEEHPSGAEEGVEHAPPRRKARGRSKKKRGEKRVEPGEGRQEEKHDDYPLKDMPVLAPKAEVPRTPPLTRKRPPVREINLEDREPAKRQKGQHPGRGKERGQRGESKEGSYQAYLRSHPREPTEPRHPERQLSFSTMPLTDTQSLSVAPSGAAYVVKSFPLTDTQIRFARPPYHRTPAGKNELRQIDQRVAYNDYAKETKTPSNVRHQRNVPTEYN